MVGWREGEIGTRMAALLTRRLAEGVEVRVIVDGAVAWIGGAGVEDHFRDGRFHEVTVRVTGDVVRQAQAAFLTSFHGHGGPLPARLRPLFPEPGDPGSTPVALAQVIPGGFVAASQAIREQIDGARGRLDVMNPYLTDGDMLERILAAARRGVRVRIVTSQRSNNRQAAAALRHRYGEILSAGIEVWEVPGTVVHTKVVVADDVVSSARSTWTPGRSTATRRS